MGVSGGIKLKLMEKREESEKWINLSQVMNQFQSP
jgi:hypothetical protein